MKFLGDAKTSALSSTFEDAQELSAGAKASATLGTFGFGGDVDHATHFMYKRKIKGYLAAVVNITSTAPEKAEEAKKLTPFGAEFEVDVKDESDSEMVKSVVNKEKISVENRGRDCFFKDGVGATMTENEFARRFEKTTGSDELADVVSRRNKGGIYSGAIATGIGVAAIGVSVPLFITGEKGDETAIPTKEESGGFTAAKYIAVIGGAIGLYGAYALIVGLSSDTAYDGNETDHKLTEIDARVYVGQYNKALVRKTVKELQKARSRSGFVMPQTTITWQPFVGASGAGVLGTF